MTTLPENAIEKLIQIEAGIHYSEPPPAGQLPFIAIRRAAPVILSAPHGAVTFRNNHKETWHEEDEYTAGIALLISELCRTSVIATAWYTADSDPNEHPEAQSTYKQELRRMVEATRARWVIDLHGAGEDSPRLSDGQKVELGAGGKDEYLPVIARKELASILEKHLGAGVADRKDKPGFRAEGANRIAAFAHYELGVHSVQLELKLSVRVPQRRPDSSLYRKSSKHGGPFSASPQHVTAMLYALAEFIEYLKSSADF